MSKNKDNTPKPNEPTITNRKASHDYTIEDTLECGIQLTGTEVKSVRQGQISLGEGYVRATETPLTLVMHSVHIAEYPPAGEAHQHRTTRARNLLAHKREILKLAKKTKQKGLTLIPLKVYFVKGRAKVLLGLARGKSHSDKRQTLAKKDAQREISRAMTKRG